MSLPPKLWQGPSPAGEASDRGNDISSGLPYRTHSGPGFRATVKGEFREVVLEGEEKEETEDSWVSASSSFLDDNVHFVSGNDPRRSFRRRYTTTSATAGWSLSSIVTVPNSKGKGYFTTTDPFSPPFAYLHMNLLGRYGRSSQLQYDITAWAYSIEYSLGFTTPAYSTEMYHIDGAECHVRSMNWAYNDGATQRNDVLLEATIKSDAGWVQYELANPTMMAHKDVGYLRFVALRPNKMAIIGCEHPDEYPSVFYGQPLGGPWTRAANTLADAFPGEVPFNAVYYLTEAAWAAAHPSVTDPDEIRMGHLSQNTYKYRIRTRGSLCRALPVDSDHVLFSTGSYPKAEAMAAIGLSVCLVEVSTGQVSNVLHREYTAPGVSYYSSEVMLGKDSWFIEFLTDTAYSSPTVYPTLLEALVTFDRGATYTTVTMPADYVPQTLMAFRPVTEVVGGVPGKYEVVMQVNEAGERRMFKSKDFENFTRGGKLAKAALTDVYADFMQIVKLGTRKDPGRINYIAPWANDTRVEPPDWW